MRALLFLGYKKGESVTQTSLFPLSLDDLVPAEHDRYRCPHQQELTRKQVNRGSVVYAAQRFVTRHAHEAAFERMEQRLATHPDIMIKRRCIVEHPFGNLKQWIFGNGRFLLRGLEGAGSEMALGVTVYNLKRAIAVLGIGKMTALLA